MLRILIILVLLAGPGWRGDLAGPVIAAENPSADGFGNSHLFDIPSQPLEDALYAFGAVTGIEVFADGSIVRGRRSSEIKGTFSAEDALRILLTGTDLNPRRISPRAVSLSVAQKDEAKGDVSRSYSALLQNAVLRKLCPESSTRLGTYRLALQLWLDDFGRVEHLELLSSTGDRQRDLRVRNLIQGLSIERPPTSLPQPVTMVILPRPAETSGDCRSE